LIRGHAQPGHRRKLRIGIVGCGKIADGHVEEIQKNPNAEAVAVCDLEPIMAEQIAVRYGICNYYSDFDRMLAAENLDVVHITTPPQSHLLLTEKAVAAGCHVYVEKPIALNYRDARKLIDTVEMGGRKLTINYWPNFDPPGLALREVIERGVIGDVVHVESYLGYNLAGPFGEALLGDAGHWVHRLPGKLFQNTLDHVLNKISPFLTDEHPDIHAMAYRRRERLNQDSTDGLLDELRVMIQGRKVSAYATFCSHARPAGHFLRIYGTRSTMHVDYNSRTAVLDAEQTLPSAIGRLVPPFSQGWRYIRQGLRNVGMFRRNQFHYFSGMNRLISLFYDSILDDRPAPIEYGEILRVSAMMDEIFSQVYAGDGK
jgi:predicted dehydrogenase